MDTLPGNTPLQNLALSTANDIINVFSTSDPSSLAKCRKKAEAVFGAAWESKGHKIYEEGAPAQVRTGLLLSVQKERTADGTAGVGHRALSY